MEYIVYCPISGCTPEAPTTFLFYREDEKFGPVVSSAIETLADAHEIALHDNLSVIGPIDPSGEEYDDGLFDDPLPDSSLRPPPEETIRVLPDCSMGVLGDLWEYGYVDGPSTMEQDRSYLVLSTKNLMVQTYALGILALATHGRMTPLRLWRLAMYQGFSGPERPDRIKGVEYGEITIQDGEECLEPFPGFSEAQLTELEEVGDLEIVMERLVHEGLFFVWMVPDRFPVAPTNHRYITPAVPKARTPNDGSAIETLPPEMLGLVVSLLPLKPLLNLAVTSRKLRTVILGSDHLARVWIYHNAPWWVPVPTQTPAGDDLDDLPETYLASEWSAGVHLNIDFPLELNWAYVGRCMRSGSMRNRRRIWKAALDIERVADLAGM